MAFIAIDLGTTNTVMAMGKKDINGFFRPDAIVIPQLDQNDTIVRKTILPSVLYVDKDGKRIVGEKAKYMKDYQPQWTIYNSKRYMGTERVWEIEGQKIRPIDVAAEILKKCKEAALRYVNTENDIELTTITVPASFNTDQIRDTIEAAKIAGFNPERLKILPEPIAALFDFINDQAMFCKEDRLIDIAEPKRFLVFDIGGGTCDVAVVDVHQDANSLKIEEKAIGRYDELGGVDFDNWACEYLMNKFFEENRIRKGDITSEEFEEMKTKLTNFCERAKESISSEIEFYFDSSSKQDFDNIYYEQSIPNFYKKNMVAFKITKKEYDLATNGLYYQPRIIQRFLPNASKFKNIESPIHETLKKENISINSIDYVFATGGMSQYIRVRERLKEIFRKDKILMPQKPLEAVARGAAVYNYYNIEIKKLSSHNIHLNNQPTNQQKDIKITSLVSQIDLKQVLSEAIMIDVAEGLPVVIIPANENIPCSGVLRGRLKTSSPTGVKINIYAGEGPHDPTMRIQKSQEGRFTSPIRTGTPLDIEYNIDENKYLTLRVVVSGTNEIINLDVNSDIRTQIRK